MYAKISDQQVVQYPYSLLELQNEHPNTSFPSNMTDADLASFGVVRVVVTGKPEHDAITENVSEASPAFVQERNRWEQQWTATTASEQEISERLSALAASVRAIRNVELALSDYTQLSDYPGGDRGQWASYRQQLRDLPAQAGFPRTVNWPAKP